MADTVASQTLMDGPRNCAMKFTNISDGTGEAAVTKVDVSALETFQGLTCTGVTIEKVEYATDGLSVSILWDATADVVALKLPQNQSDTLDFKDIGGLKNNAGAGKTGDIQFTTVGHTAGDTYTIILHMKKNY